MGIYAKSGTSLEGGQGFVFTGNVIGSNWEIQKPPSAGAFIHGVTNGYTDEFNIYTGQILGVGPMYVEISANVNAQAELSIGMDGKFKPRGESEALAGIALMSGSAGNSCIAFIYGLSTPLNMPSLTQGDFLVKGMTGWQRLPATTVGYVLTTNGAGTLPSFQQSSGNLLQSMGSRVTIDQTTTSSSLSDLSGASVTISITAGSKVLVNASYSCSNTSALGAISNIVLDVDGSVDSGCALTFPLLANYSQGGSICRLITGLSAGSHTFKIRWSTLAGTLRCRPVTSPNSDHASLTVIESKV